MFSFSYPASLRPDKDGRPVVRFPDFPRQVDCQFPGNPPGHETRSEKLQSALEALGKRIVVLVEDAA